MISLEKIKTISKSPEHDSSPRISFSTDFLDEENFISISPKPEPTDKGKSRVTDFEFLSNIPSSQRMITADELFFEGKLLPFCQIQHIDKLSRISLGENTAEQLVQQENNNNNNNNMVDNGSSGGRVWFIDDDPSPRPPTCTVLWKELLRLKKQRAASSLSPSSSSSSTSTSSTGLQDMSVTEEVKEGSGKKEKNVKRIKKMLERTKSTSIKIRPMVNVPVCAQGKSNGLAPLFSSLKKGRLER